MAEEHDKTHRLLFSFRRMIADLIRLCLGGDWVERLDFSTLEKVPERLLSRELVRREQDVIWRLAYTPTTEEAEPDWFYVYLHLEHQSSPRRLMALDMVAYKTLVWQDLARRKALAGNGMLPPILSVVFYTGEKDWDAEHSLLDLVERVPDAPADLDLWSYRLIDAQRYPLAELLGSESPLVGLFRLEQLEGIDGLSATARELRAVIGPDDEELADAFVELINEEILPKLDLPEDQRIRITDLEELPTMLSQRIERITQGWMMEGWEKGVAEGEARGLAKGEAKGKAEGKVEGKAEGERELFLEFFAAKFGDVPARVRERVAAASEGKLKTWAKRLLRAGSPEDVFEG